MKPTETAVRFDSQHFPVLSRYHPDLVGETILWMILRSGGQFSAYNFKKFALKLEHGAERATKKEPSLGLAFPAEFMTHDARLRSPKFGSKENP